MMQEPVRPLERGASERIKDFEEVVFKYSEEEALREANRCLQCKDPLCIKGCPVGIDIKKFIRHIREKDYRGAYFEIRKKNNFPSICGRVCPAEYQCRKTCVLNSQGAPFASEKSINIHFLERFAGDYAMLNNLSSGIPETRPGSKSFKVAVVGSGPAGLSVAGELAREGIKTVVFEALHKAGGVLRYGIPPFRLPGEVLDYEINYLKQMGVEFVLNCIIGKTKSLQDLKKEGFSAFFLGLGAGVPSFLGIKGENLPNVYSANEFLTRVNLMSAYRFPEYHTPVNIAEKVVVVGGGNTAVDAARVALRLQRLRGLKGRVSILYRRTEKEMPARRLEIEHAKEEGIEFKFLVQPEELLADSGNRLEKIKCLRCRLGEPDSSGRRRPVVIENSAFSIECGLAIIAIGLGANRVLTSSEPALETNRRGEITIKDNFLQSSLRGVFAGGDIVGGEGTVIEAMSMGKTAAAGITRFLKSGSLPF
ncbi:MAG: NADPH-dependent glutamate synthase [Candidatus Omnitrophica bacterium]|nr:NADPH-dependent glutamate synthase [Candidatus Omnitrophota bacterium]MBD3268768.1 NADPH-dependent glutamate synthase [Candidatus Omnitrophota bacterium]